MSPLLSAVRESRARCRRAGRRGIAVALASAMLVGGVFATGAQADDLATYDFWNMPADWLGPDRGLTHLVKDDETNTIAGLTSDHMWSLDFGFSWHLAGPDTTFPGAKAVLVTDADADVVGVPRYMQETTYPKGTTISHISSLWISQWEAAPGERPGVNQVWKRVKFIDQTNWAVRNFTPWTGAKAEAFQSEQRAAGFEQKKVVGYFPEWGIYDAHDNFGVSDIPFEDLTHLNYGFALLKQDSARRWSIGVADEWAALEKDGGLYDQVARATQRAGVENMLSIGGWTNSENGEFEAATSTVEKTEQIAQMMVDFMVEHGFTGLDIDWEYPSDDTGAARFERLISVLKGKLTDLGKVNDDYYPLTIAVTPNHTKMQYIKPEVVTDLVDTVNVMSYDYHGAFDPVTGHNAPLHANAIDSDPKLNIESTMREYHEVHGIPKEQLLVGVPFYGRAWGGVEPTELIAGLPGLGAPGHATSHGAWDEPKQFTGTNPWYVMKELEKEPSVTRYWDAQAKVPYLYDSQTKELFTYDDPTSVQEKVDFIKRNEYGGAIIWDLSGDTKDRQLSTIVGTVLDESIQPEPLPEPEPEPQPEPEPEPTVPAVGVPDASKSTSRVDGKAVLGDGTASHTLAVTLKDGNGDGVTGLVGAKFPAEVQVGGIDVEVSAFKESGAGMYYADVTSTRAGSANLTVSLNGTPIGAPLFAQFSEYVPGQPDRSRSSIRVVSQSRLPDGKQAHVMSLVVKDASGKVVTGQAANLPFDMSFREKVGTSYVDTDKLTASGWTETPVKGTYEMSVTSRTPGTFTVYAHLNGSQVAAGTNAFTFTTAQIGGISTETSRTTMTSTVVLGDGKAAHTLSVSLKDAAGNPVSGLAGTTFPATTTLTGGATIGAWKESGAKGSYYAYITSTKPGVVSADVKLDGVAIGSTVTGEFSEYVPGQAARSTSVSKVAAGSKLADGRDAATVVLTLKDASGVVVTGMSGAAMPVTVSISGPQGVDTSGVTMSPFVETSVKGTYEATVTSTTAGTFNATARLGTGQLPSSGTSMTFLDSKV